jgi:hypothetical protein
MAYLHSDWVSKETVFKQHIGKQRLGRFMSKNPSFEPEEPIQPSFLAVEKVIASSLRGPDPPEEDEEVVETVPKDDEYDELLYLVKWKGHQYSLCTWELPGLIKHDRAIARFHIVNSYSQAPAWSFPKPDLFEEMLPGEEYTNESSRSLLPHQLAGVNWLISSWYNRTKTILADEV